MKPKLIVTGLCGLIGSHFKAQFEENYDLIPIDIAVGVDLTDPTQVATVVTENSDAQAVIHLAAFTDVSGAYSQQDDKTGLCYRLNVTGTENIVAACKEHDLYLVHVSTDFVFDGTNPEGYDESSTPNPIEWYGETKFLAEEVVRNSDVKHSIMRIAFPYVPGDAARSDLVAKIRERLASGEEATLFTDQTITPTFAGDIITALELIARTQPENELFHVTGSTSLSPHELGLAVAQAFDLDTNLVKPSLMEEYLKKDPRPRQQYTRIKNGHYSTFALAQNHPAPLTIEEGLRKLKA